MSNKDDMIVRLTALILSIATAGCTRTVSMHVWTPSEVGVPSSAKVALGPVAGSPALSNQIEQAILNQRPLARADVAVFTAEQLALHCPVRVVSTSELSNDLAALEAARTVGANILLQGEILSADVDLSGADTAAMPKQIDYNNMFFAKKKEDAPVEQLLISWRVIDVSTSRLLGSRVSNLTSEQAAERYPDLEAIHDDNTDLLLAASARETWKSIAPVVEKEKVRLAVPWLQPGAIRTHLGIRAARKGNWASAEQHWEKATKWFWFNSAGQHNLALALAAREDFAGAKEQLEKARGPLAFSVPDDTLYWLDTQQRLYHQAHGLPAPPEGWTFTTPTIAADAALEPVEPVELSDLPWWTALPLAKPPGWTWREWLTQPLVIR